MQDSRVEQFQVKQSQVEQGGGTGGDRPVADGRPAAGKPLVENASGSQNPGLADAGEALRTDGQPETTPNVGGDRAREVDAAGKAAEETNRLTLEVQRDLQEELKEFSSELLQIEAKGGDVSLAIRERGQQLVQEGEDAGKEGPPSLTEAQISAKIALGYDLQIRALQLKQAQLKEAAKDASGRKLQALESRFNEITQEIDKLRQEKAAKVKIETGDPLAEFAQKAFGASEEDARENPFATISDKIAEAITDSKKRDSLIINLEKSGYFTEEPIKSFEKFLKTEYWKKKGAEAAKMAGIISLFILLMGWLASRDRR